jgi:hypothetical protein
MLTTQQHVLHILEAATRSLVIEEIQSFLCDRQVKITLAEIDRELDQLISDTWVEYYGIKRPEFDDKFLDPHRDLYDSWYDPEEITIGYELCNRWYNLEPSKRDRILGVISVTVEDEISAARRN